MHVTRKSDATLDRRVMKGGYVTSISVSTVA